MAAPAKFSSICATESITLAGSWSVFLVGTGSSESTSVGFSAFQTLLFFGAVRPATVSVLTVEILAGRCSGTGGIQEDLLMGVPSFLAPSEAQEVP